jgi:hypothetical protein
MLKIVGADGKDRVYGRSGLFNTVDHHVLIAWSVAGEEAMWRSDPS